MNLFFLLVFSILNLKLEFFYFYSYLQRLYHNQIIFLHILFIFLINSFTLSSFIQFYHLSYEAFYDYLKIDILIFFLIDLISHLLDLFDSFLSYFTSIQMSINVSHSLDSYAHGDLLSLFYSLIEFAIVSDFLLMRYYQVSQYDSFQLQYYLILSYSIIYHVDYLLYFQIVLYFQQFLILFIQE